MNAVRQAIRVISDRGMAKGISKDADGRVCVGGAISIALSGHPSDWFSDDFSLAIQAVSDVAIEQYPERQQSFDYGLVAPAWWGAQTFNNHPATTSDELIRVMDKASVRLDEVLV